MVLGVNQRKGLIVSNRETDSQSCYQAKASTKTIFLQLAGDMCFSGEMQYEVGPACKHLSYLEWFWNSILSNMGRKIKPALVPATCPWCSTYLWRVMGLFGEWWGLSPALYKLYLFP